MLSKLSLLLVLLFVATLPATASDEVHFGQNIRVPYGTSADDIVCFLCSVDAEGEVRGDIVVFGGNLRLAGAAHQDVVVFGGNLAMEGDASIGQDLVIFGGSLKSGPQPTINGDRVVFPFAIFIPIILVLVAILFGAFLLIRWIIDRFRPAYVPQRR